MAGNTSGAAKETKSEGASHNVKLTHASKAREYAMAAKARAKRLRLQIAQDRYPDSPRASVSSASGRGSATSTGVRSHDNSHNTAPANGTANGTANGKSQSHHINRRTAEAAESRLASEEKAKEKLKKSSSFMRVVDAAAEFLSSPPPAYRDSGCSVSHVGPPPPEEAADGATEESPEEITNRGG